MELTRDTELTLQESAALCGTCDKTIQRRINKGMLPSRKRDDRRTVVTVGALEEAGLYTFGAESAAELSRAARLEQELARVVAQRAALEAELRVVRAQLVEVRHTNEQYVKMLLTRDKALTAVLKDVA